MLSLLVSMLVCCMQIQSSNFTQNTAKSSGSVLLADDDSQISFNSSSLTSNGNYSCYDPPMVSCTCLSPWALSGGAEADQARLRCASGCLGVSW